MLLFSKIARASAIARFAMFVDDEYTAKKMELATKKLAKKLGNKDVGMKWQWVKDGKKMVIACDFYELESK